MAVALDDFVATQSADGSSGPALSTGTLSISTAAENDVICVIMTTYQTTGATATLDGTAMTVETETPTTTECYIVLMDAVAASVGTHTIAYSFPSSSAYGTTGIVAYAISGATVSGALYGSSYGTGGPTLGTVTAGSFIIGFEADNQLSGSLPPPTTAVGTFVNQANAAFGIAYTSANSIAGSSGGSATVSCSTSITIMVSAAAYPEVVSPALTADSPPSSVVTHTDFSYTYAASGYPAPTFSVSSGTLPVGLALSSGGVLSGTPTTIGTYTFAVAASNIGGAATSGTQTITITPGAPYQLAFTTSPPASAVAGAAWAQFAVSVEDAYGNVVTSGAGSTDAIHVVIASGPTGGREPES